MLLDMIFLRLSSGSLFYYVKYRIFFADCSCRLTAGDICLGLKGDKSLATWILMVSLGSIQLAAWIVRNRIYFLFDILKLFIIISFRNLSFCPWDETCVRKKPPISANIPPQFAYLLFSFWSCTFYLFHLPTHNDSPQ